MEWSRESILASAFRLIWVTCPKLHDLQRPTEGRMQITIDGKKSSPLRLLLAHGAGAPSDSDFMNQITALLVERGLCVGRFEFPYMQKRRGDGKKRPPDREPILRQAFQEAVTEFNPKGKPCFIGGKSMGGRLATMVAADNEVDVAGIVCLGYPFHPTGRPEKLRTAHLENIAVPTLIAQGERDPFGNLAEFASYAIQNCQIELLWLADGNHDLKPRKASGLTQEEHLKTVADKVAQWMQSQ